MAILNSKITFAAPSIYNPLSAEGEEVDKRSDVGVSNYLPTFAINQNYNYFSADSCLKQKL